MRAYDHLFFDLDNTLWDFTTNSRLAMFEMLQHTNLLNRLPDFETFFSSYESINSKLWDDYHFKRTTKQKLIVERFYESFKLFNINNQNWEDLNRVYLERMAVQDHLITGTIETLEALRLQQYQMYIITNGFREVQYKKLSNCGLSKYFIRVFISEEIQSTKPHREIFEYAIKSSNAKKNRSLMIGDSWETDILGALNFGIDQVMFLNNHQNKVPYEINTLKNRSNTHFLQLKNAKKTYFIQNITELIKILQFRNILKSTNQTT